MLKRLTIEQFVIIDKLSIDFQSGLTVVTGETGAGKSIMLDAMGLVLGEEPNREAIRQGADASIIEAVFTTPAANPLWKFLTDHGLPASVEKEMTIRRTIGHDNKDEILLNGKNVELKLLKKIGNFLVEIHGQFANRNLLDPANQLSLLDAFGAYPPEVFKNLTDALNDVHRYTAELEEEKNFIARHGHEMQKLDMLAAELDRLGMNKSFVEETKAEHARLQTAKETSEAFQSILGQLIASTGASSSLLTANQTLARQKHIDRSKVQTLGNYLAAALDNTRAAIDEMQRLKPEYDVDTSPLHKLEETLKTLKRIAAEHKIPIEELHDLYEHISGKLNRIRNGRVQIRKLDEFLEKAKTAYRQHARVLSDHRIAAGKALNEAINAELPPLKLLEAQFEVKVEQHTTMIWTNLGLDHVTFTARMNPGMPFSSIAETASGGELSRLILALKVVLQRVQTIPTLVFDEVDTGTGGAASAAVGERMARLANTTQVLVITHSPQVAARGNQHMHVSKKTDGVTTTSVVSGLSPDECIDEISRMLAGDTITPEARAAAKSLIAEASKAAQAR